MFGIAKLGTLHKQGNDRGHFWGIRIFISGVSIVVDILISYLLPVRVDYIHGDTGSFHRSPLRLYLKVESMLSILRRVLLLNKPRPEGTL